MNFLHTILGQDFEQPAIIDETDPAVTYVGYAAPGTTGTDQPKFAIKKISSISGITTIQWADGDKKKTKVWNDRASFTYKFL